MLRVVDRINTWVEGALLAVACLFLLIMMLHITVDVTVRYFFNATIIGTLETVSYYHMVLAVFLPLAYVESRGEHIRVDLIAQALPRQVQLVLYVFTCLLGLAFFGALAYRGYLDAVRSTQRLETIMSNYLFYIWPSRWALPLGFGALCLAILNNLLKALVRRQAL